MLVDDSIVRGTTSARTIRLLREAGAAEVHYRISAPPFAHPCYFGTDIPDEKDLIATGHTVEEINELVGSDTLGYLSIEHVQQLAIHSKCGFCTGCFTGKYACGRSPLTEGAKPPCLPQRGEVARSAGGRELAAATRFSE